MRRATTCLLSMFVLIGLIGLTGAQPAFAQSGASPAASVVGSGAEAKAPGPFVVGAGVGAIFPQAFSQLGTHVLVGVELGYRFRFLAQRFEAMFDVGYSPPGRSFEITRSEGIYQGKVVSQQLHFSLAPRVRIMPGSSPWNITLAVGPRLFLLKSTSNGARDGQAFVEFSEQSTEIGVFAAVGGEYMLGPGALFLDLSLAWAPMPHVIMGDPATDNSVSAGNIALALGYRLFLPF